MFFGERSARPAVLLTALALVMLLVAPLIVHATMPSTIIAFDFANQADNNGSGSVSSLSWSHTVGSGSNGILLVGVEFTIPTSQILVSVDYGVNHLKVLAGDSSGSEELDTFYLLNPPAGTNTVMVTFTGGSVANVLGGSVSVFNVAQVRPSTVSADDLHNGATIQLTVPANTGDLVIAAIMTNKGTVLTPGPGQITPVGWTQKLVNGGFVGAASYAPASSPVTLSWTATLPNDSGSIWIMVGADLQPAPAIIPEYPLGLPLLAIFMIISYGLIRRRTSNKKS